VDAVSEDETPADRGKRFDELDIEAILRGVRVRLGTDSIALSMQEGVYLVSESLEVLLCPAELLKGTPQQRHGESSP
jgi:hypothetical protein